MNCPIGTVSPVSALSGEVPKVMQLLHYKGRIFNDPDIEGALWDNYLEDGGNPDNHDEWESYVMHNAVNYLEDVIYFTESE